MPTTEFNENESETEINRKIRKRILLKLLSKAHTYEREFKPPVSRPVTTQYLIRSLEDLKKENEMLKSELSRIKKTPSIKIGIAFIVVGALALTASITSSSPTLAFIGLGLTFWGALFLFARPIKFVRGTLLDHTAISSYKTIDRIVENLDYRGKPVHIPPYPKKAYLPEYLKGLKEMIVFIPAKDFAAMPTIEEMAKKRFQLPNPEGVCVASPGAGLVELFEKELRIEFTEINLDTLYDSLPTVIVRDLELARELEINSENNLIHVKIVDSVYKGLYSGEHGLKSVRTIGCPLTSAIACALAKTTGKLVTIAKDTISPDLQTIDVWYQTLEG
jgi:hypothetical protein